MALDPSDLLESPFNFGECYEKQAEAVLRCKTWEVEEHTINIFLRKRGQVVEFVMPEALYKSKKEGEKDLIQFSLNLTEDEKIIWLGEYPKSMRFLCYGFNGCEKNSDELTNELTTCMLVMDFEGNFYISPSEDDEGFTPSYDGDQIGLVSVNFSYVPNDDVDVQLAAKKQKTS